MKLIRGEFKERLDLLFAPSIKAGFPSSADDYLRDRLNNRFLRERWRTFVSWTNKFLGIKFAWYVFFL